MWYKKNVQNERKIRIYTHTQNIRIEKFHYEIILSQPLEVAWSCLFRPSEKGLECTELINRYRYTHVSRDKPEEAEIRLKNRPSIYIYIYSRDTSKVRDNDSSLYSASIRYNESSRQRDFDVFARLCTNDAGRFVHPLRIFLSLLPFLFLFTLQRTRRQILISDIHRSQPPSFRRFTFPPPSSYILISMPVNGVNPGQGYCYCYCF